MTEPGHANEYAGDTQPDVAWQALQSDANARLVDVRTRPEWAFVGVPDLSTLESPPVFVEWQQFPSMQVNPHFAQQLESAGISPGQPLYFICRSGARSRAAAIAATDAGLGPAYNVSGGFEGDHDADRHRGQTNGWKADGLPWVQD